MKTMDDAIANELLAACFSEPEADLQEVARWNFENLSSPILVAAATIEQFDEFVFRNGLCCSEVRRFRSYTYHRRQPSGKILLILPMYYDDPSTSAAVDQWVEDDRWTVQLDAPFPTVGGKFFWLFVVVIIGLLALIEIVMG